jgi:hypothetical protein
LRKKNEEKLNSFPLKPSQTNLGRSGNFGQEARAKVFDVRQNKEEGVEKVGDHSGREAGLVILVGHVFLLIRKKELEKTKKKRPRERG